MEQEKIYVLVPVYNVEAYLERCIDSILNQTYTNWELVLINDGSKDNSGVICNRYAAEHENITVIHQENGGVSVARNTAVAYALEHGDHQRDWINFVDSDDFVHPKYLEYLHRAAKEAYSNFSSCGYFRTSSYEIEPSAPSGYTCISPEVFWKKRFTNANVPWGKLYRMYLFKNIRYPVGKVFEDNFTTYKILFQFDKIPVVEARLYYWYINSSSITMAKWMPSQIDKVDAAEAQLAYLKANGFTQASKRSAQYMLWGCVKCLKDIHKLSPKYDHLIPEMEARQKEAFRLYAKEVGWITASCYWLMVRYIAPAYRRLKRKVKRILHH